MSHTGVWDLDFHTVTLSMESQFSCHTPHGVQVRLSHTAWSPSSTVSHRMESQFPCHTQHGVPVPLSHTAWSPSSPVTLSMESPFPSLTPHGFPVRLSHTAWSPSSPVSIRMFPCHDQYGVPVPLSHTAWIPSSPGSHRMESQFACLAPRVVLVPVSHRTESWSASLPVSHRSILMCSARKVHVRDITEAAPGSKPVLIANVFCFILFL